VPVLVHPGAQFGAKRWPVERFAQVAAALNRPDAPVLVTGSAAERPLAVEVAGRAGLAESRVFAGRTDLDQLCDLVAGAGLVVCGDTGVAHLASAFGTPSVVLFGPVDPAQWGPPADGPHIVLNDPAQRRGDPFADDPDPALLAIGVGQVLRAAAAARRRAPRGP
jgi:ADP-heptose:LPS heptosyltransferase